MTSMSVYNGRVRLGTIRQDDAGEFVALDLADHRLGRFRTRAEALGALPADARHGGAPTSTARDRGRYLGLDRHARSHA